VPRYSDDDLVPPLKVMRKRLNGVYRADSGFSGPTRRYVLLVALLVGLASVPTLAAITAGSNELADGKTDTLDIPVLPPASPGPVIDPDQDLPQSGLPPSTQGGSDGAQAAVRAGRLMGEAGKRRPKAVARSGPDGHKAGDRDGYAGKGQPSSDSDPGSSPAGSAGTGSGSAGTGSGSAGTGSGSAGSGSGASGSDKGSGPADPAMIAFPALPGMRSLPGLPAIDGRRAQEPGELPSVPDEPADSDARDEPVPDSPDSPDAQDPPDLPEKPVVSDSDDEPDKQGRSNEPEEPGHRREEPPATRPCEESSRRRKQVSSTTSHRSPDRSEDSRRSTVTERPRNVRPASILDRSYANPPLPGAHNRRHIPEARGEARGEDNQMAGRPYHGAHRASSHHADETPAQRRSSRVGRHHAEHSEDLSGRW
jgi:hypothetical protein